MFWYDYRLKWNPSNYAGIDEITAPVTKVWTPAIILSSSATKDAIVLQDWNHVRFSSSGEVYTMQPILVQSSCSMDLRYFPFDTQSCDTVFMSFAYKDYEVEIGKKYEGISLKLYLENALWDIVSTNVSSELVPHAKEMQIHFIFNLKRKSQYVMISVLLPIMFLGLLNTVVFLLVSDSGDRVGFCITILLAITVYMTIVMDILPQSSTPIPSISYKLLGDLFCSALITVCVVINQRINGRADDKPVPAWLKDVHRFLTCKICRRKSEAMDNKPPTWKDISHLKDVISFAVFFSIAIFSLIIFVGNATYQSSLLI